MVHTYSTKGTSYGLGPAKVFYQFFGELDQDLLFVTGRICEVWKGVQTFCYKSSSIRSKASQVILCHRIFTRTVRYFPMTTRIVFILSVLLVLHKASAEPDCTLGYCSRNGKRAKCDFVQANGIAKTITCRRWPRKDPTACIADTCEVDCPGLPRRGPVCEFECPDCKFEILSCQSSFKLTRASDEECGSTPEPVMSPSPSPKPKKVVKPPQDCGLLRCSKIGAARKCMLDGIVITCGEWPQIKENVCPTVFCKPCNLPAQTGPVCVKCAECGFVFYSCQSNFELYRDKMCGLKRTN